MDLLAYNESDQLKALPTTAVPKVDGSDTLVFLEALEHNPIKKVLPIQVGETDLFDGHVAVRYGFWEESLKNKFEKAPSDHPNIGRAIELLKICWPEAYEQFKSIIREFTPVFLANNKKTGQYGSMSHQPPNTYGSIWATINDPICLTQALVHELAHNKLFAIGQEFERSAPLFRNQENELYDSPVRLDIPRPMSAIFHGLYAFTHVVAIDNRMISSGRLTNEDTRYVKKLLYKNVKRVKRAYDIVKNCGISTLEGQAFVQDALCWASTEISNAEPYMDQTSDKKFCIIGPSRLDRGLIGEFLSSKKKRILLDEVCWDYWFGAATFQEILNVHYDPSRVYLFNKTLTSEQKRELIQMFLHKGLLSESVIDKLKLDLIISILTKHADKAVIEIGTDHCLFFDQSFLHYLKERLQNLNVEVVLVRPMLNLHQSVQWLEGGLKDGENVEERPVYQALNSPSYRTLADYVVDSISLREGRMEDSMLSQLA